MKDFAQLLKKHLDADGRKHKTIATAAHISANYLSILQSEHPEKRRQPSAEVVYNLGMALRLSVEQIGELLAAAGFAPSVDLLRSVAAQYEQGAAPVSVTFGNDSLEMRLAQQVFRLAQDVPAEDLAAFGEESRHLFGYLRYKYVLSGGSDILDLEPMQVFSFQTGGGMAQRDLDLIAQLVGGLHPETADVQVEEHSAGAAPRDAEVEVVEDLLAAIDRLAGSILAGEVSAGNYQPQIVVQMAGILQEGAPWEIRRRIAEALPGLCRLDVTGTEQLMETLRADPYDEVYRVDIRRRIVEALRPLFETSPTSLPTVLHLLLPCPEDDIYVALANVEACGDIQARIKQMLDGSTRPEPPAPAGYSSAFRGQLQAAQVEIARIQRQLLAVHDGPEREYLLYSMTLHDLLCAPDTLLHSLREGLHSTSKHVQLTAARYLERVLLVRPQETLELYKEILEQVETRNVRRTVAKAMPTLLQCLQETSYATRVLARTIINTLATDQDIHIRRTVADYAMQIFRIDREYLLVLLHELSKGNDPSIRHRLHPVVLRLAEVWLTWYARTAGLIAESRAPGNKGKQKALPYGDET